MKMEIRADDSIRLTGYVNVTARDSRPIPSPQGAFIEQVTPGTFRKALSANPNVEMLFNHERKLCDQQSGLMLREDDIGLYADATFTDAEVADKGRRHELQGWSFGFTVNADHWDDAGKRYLDDINLEEVSILDKTPAYIATSVEMRDGKQCEFRTSEVELEDIEVEAREDPKEQDENDDSSGQVRALYHYLKYKEI